MRTALLTLQQELHVHQLACNAAEQEQAALTGQAIHAKMLILLILQVINAFSAIPAIIGIHRQEHARGFFAALLLVIAVVVTAVLIFYNHQDTYANQQYASNVPH